MLPFLNLDFVALEEKVEGIPQSDHQRQPTEEEDLGKACRETTKREQAPADELTLPMARRPLSKKSRTPRNRKKVPKPIRPTPISVSSHEEMIEKEEGMERRDAREQEAVMRT